MLNRSDLGAHVLPILYHFIFLLNRVTPYNSGILGTDHLKAILEKHPFSEYLFRGQKFRRGLLAYIWATPNCKNRTGSLWNGRFALESPHGVDPI